MVKTPCSHCRGMGSIPGRGSSTCPTVQPKYICRALLCAVVSDSLWPHGLQPTKLPCPWDFLGKNAGVGCHFLFQEIFRTQDWNPSLLYLLNWQADSVPLYHLGSPIYIYTHVYIYIYIYTHTCKKREFKHLNTHGSATISEVLGSSTLDAEIAL